MGMTETRNAREIAIDFYRAEYGLTDVAEMVDELDADELASIVAAVNAQPHLAPRS
jgi:hypothetical protein